MDAKLSYYLWRDMSSRRCFKKRGAQPVDLL